MNRTRRMGVVKVEGMGKRPVDESSCHRGIGAAIAHDRAFALGKPEFFDRGNQAWRRLRVISRADDDAREIENEPFGTLGNFGRKILVTEIHDKGCQLLCDFCHVAASLIRPGF